MSWWRDGVVYQVYPRSFQDSNGDGVGDLEGIRSRLPYLEALGVDAVWISPIFPSPMADFGYDVADYTDVDPLFGSLEDMDRLIADAHARGLKVVLDLVPNHTSDQHPWFQDSRARGEKSDWYIWRDPAPDGGPPNNWLSYFGGAAWTLDPERGQYYLHQFLKEQPELDHRNPEVRAAIQEAMRFWFRRGVDGFRVDVIALMIKHPDFPDDPPNPSYRPGIDMPTHQFEHVHRQDRPEVHGVIREMRAVCDEFDDRAMIGEIYLPPAKLATYYGDGDECHLPFNFGLLLIEDWTPGAVRDHVQEFEAALPAGAWPNYVLGNHDQPRIATKVGAARARGAELLLLTLRGTPTVYYGEELGMEDVPVPRELWQDPAGLNQPDFSKGSRDPERTPMQWSAQANAGFCAPEVTPWLPVAEDFAARNVAAQEANPGSFLNFFRAALALRRAEPALHAGEIEFVEAGSEDLLAYLRRHGEDRLVVVINFSEAPRTADLSSLAPEGEVLLSTHGEVWGDVNLAAVEVPAGGGLVIRL